MGGGGLWDEMEQKNLKKKQLTQTFLRCLESQKMTIYFLLLK